MLRGDVILCRLPMPSTLLSILSIKRGRSTQKFDFWQKSNFFAPYLLDGVELASAGVVVPSAVRCEALMTVPKTMILRVLGHLSTHAMTAIDECLKDALALLPV